jgi:hypothetical protein
MNPSSSTTSLVVRTVSSNALYELAGPISVFRCPSYAKSLTLVDKIADSALHELVEIIEEHLVDEISSASPSTSSL